MKNKIKRISIGFLIVLGIGVFIIAEPLGNNPLSKCQIEETYKSTFVQSEEFQHYKAGNVKLKTDSIFWNSLKLHDYLGASAGIYGDSHGLWLGTGGFSNKKRKETPNAHTQFRIASISKLMTAVGVMKLVEEGHLALDKSINTYTKYFEEDKKGLITVRQLLSHTSGIDHYSSLWDGMSFTHYKNTRDAISEFENRPLQFEPGTGYLYTTYGYTLLAHIIEEASGLGFEEFMHKTIWEPAGMMHTQLENTNEGDFHRASLYIKWGGVFVKSPSTDLSVKYAGGGILSTASDLIKFGRSLLNYTIIDSTSLSNMMQYDDLKKRGSPYGLGCFVDDKEGRMVISHGGSQSGCSSFFQIDLDRRIVAVALANNFNSDDEVYFLVNDLMHLFQNTSHFNRPSNYYQPQSVTELSKFVGKYKEGDHWLEISQKGGQLFMQLDQYPKVPVFSSSAYRFFARRFDGVLNFGNKGKTVNYAYKGRGQNFVRIEE